MAKHGAKVKRYWSGIKNVRGRMIRDDKTGRDARKAYFERTGDTKFRESNYQKKLKQGKTYKIAEIRTANKNIMASRDKNLRNEFNRLKKEGKVTGKFKDFARANPEQDFDEIQEMFNSP